MATKRLKNENAIIEQTAKKIVVALKGLDNDTQRRVIMATCLLRNLSIERVMTSQKFTLTPTR